MYTLSISRDLIAHHFLFGGDWGAENERHSHHYKIEVQLCGKVLNPHGYLVNIIEIEKNLNEIIAYFKDSMLNDLPEFKGLNPSIEHFSRIFCQKFIKKIKTKNLTTITTFIWENDIAWASFRQEL